MIRILDDQVVNRIAAGEVVERPASVVKELVENALDAGATRIDVALKAGGRSLIRVVDDGSGMDRQDAMLCIERHATSKIENEGDLFQIASLGFRGEALPSIASVSRFEIVTRARGQDVGTRVRLEGGNLVAVDDIGAPEGTSVEARSLFFNVPARRKFLRAEATELGHCLEAVTRVALGRWDVDFAVTHDDREVLRAPKAKDRASRAKVLLGEHGRALIPVAFSAEGFDVEGLVSPVGVHKGDATGSSYLYVNGRHVKDPIVRRGVAEAYRGIVPKGRHPVVVLEVKLNPELVDVNVHPSKTEVRFRNPFDLVRVLADGLRAALEKEGIRQPVERAGPAAQPLPMRHAPLQPPQRDDDTPRLPLTTRNPEGDRFDLGVDPGRAQGRTYTMPTAKRPLSAHPDDDPRFVADSPGWKPGATGVEVSPEPLPLSQRPQADHRALLPVPRFRDLKVIGQFHDTYVLCEGGGELVIVDQHAAHERVTLHRLRKDREARIGSAQRLLTPEVVELPLAQAALLRDRLDVLRDLRLDVEPFGPAAFAVTGVPLALVGTDLAALLRDLADDLQQNLKGRAGEDVVEHFLATMACHNSVRANQPLTPAEMRALLVSLDEVDVAVCAHGRPVAIRVTAAELEHRFHRT